MTPENPNTPQQSETDQETLRLKETLRAAEWQIEQQNKAFDTIERKAVQLITLYAVIIAFFISLNIWSKNFEELTSKLLFILLILAVAALISSIALASRPSEKADNNSIHFLQERNDFNTMMQVLLDDYVKRYDINATALRGKTNCFVVASIIGGGIIYIVCGLFIFVMLKAWLFD